MFQESIHTTFQRLVARQKNKEPEVVRSIRAVNDHLTEALSFQSYWFAQPFSKKNKPHSS